MEEEGTWNLDSSLDGKPRKFQEATSDTAKLTYSTAVSDKTQNQTRPNVISKKQHVVSAFFGFFFWKAMREQELNGSTQAN